MLRDELLRSKNDEIARCLLSRKRKLSELYFATVYFGGAPGGAPHDSLYQQKEQAFLDANDLSKGRCFNEAALPPLPDYAAIIARVQERNRSSNDAEKPPEGTFKTTEAANASSPEGTGDVTSAKAAANLHERHWHGYEERDDVARGQDVTDPEDQDQVDISTPAVPARTPPALEGEASEVVQFARSPGPTQPPGVTVPETPVSSTEQLAPDISSSPGQPHSSLKKQGQDVLVAREGAPTFSAVEVPARRKRAQRPSLALSAPALFTGQPLSPASSVGPYSSNTPVPPVGSPDTSPGEETADPVIELAKPTPVNHHSSVLAVSEFSELDVISSTPTKLKLEEAQSRRQHSAFATSKGMIDASQPLEDPLANEAIGGNVEPSALEMLSVGRVDSSKEPRLQHPSAREETDRVVEISAERISEEVVSGNGYTTVIMEDKSVGTTVATPTPSMSKRIPVATPSSQPQAERMTTRVSSGAIRHKSVSEILGETPKQSACPTDKGSVERLSMESTWATSVVQTPLSSNKDSPTVTARIRFKNRKEREKERSKLSTVVFPKQQIERHESADLVRQNTADLASGLNQEQDYLFMLFQSKAYSPPRAVNLNTLLSSAHKTLSTSNHLLNYQEQMDCRTLQRIYSLQSANRWPLRQMKRSVEPSRQATHWDILLGHMKWMRTDFREERKWKIVAAKSCADWCAEYVNSDPEQQALLRVSVKIPLKTETSFVRESETFIFSQEDLVDEPEPLSHPTPELVPSTEDDSLSEGFADEPHADLRVSAAPAEIFSLGSDEFSFSMDITPAAEKLLEELPLYTPIKIVPETGLPTPRIQPDSDWKTDILPISKYVMGSIHFRDDGPMRKRSRYDYSQLECESDADKVDLPPEQTNVALFWPENKHIRDRIHPGHSFRPPAEHPMPSVAFFESRQSSQWTYAEDDELRRLVKEYSYNWSLISNCLSSPSLFSSGAERRTPWECFERWIGLEGLPADMSKIQYFRAYHQRLETAQRNLLSQQVAQQQQQAQPIQQQQQQGIAALPQPPVRRRTTQPIRVDRRRSSRHLALLDAMRKLAKKRETMLQKQQHATHLASLRKANETNHPKPLISSPAGFSKLKHERELKTQERQEQYRQQMIAQQRANLAAQRTGQLPNQQPMMNGGSARTSNGIPSGSGILTIPSAIPNGIPNGINQGRSHPMQGVSNGVVANAPLASNSMTVKMVPQTGMPQPLGARPGVPMQASPDNARVIREASRVQEQQRILQSRQQQQQQQQQQFQVQQPFTSQGSHSTINISSANGGSSNPAMLATLQAAGGMQNSSFHNAASQIVSAASPRISQQSHLSSGVIPTISSIQTQIQRSNPNMPAEQVAKIAAERLHQFQQQQRMSQVTMNAAASNVAAVQANFQAHDGNVSTTPTTAIPNGGTGVSNSPAQGYSPMMRVSQPSPQNRVTVNSPAMNGAGASQTSRSATPQTQRSGSVQSSVVPGISKSPHPPQAQITSS